MLNRLTEKTLPQASSGTEKSRARKSKIDVEAAATLQFGNLRRDRESRDLDDVVAAPALEQLACLARFDGPGCWPTRQKDSVRLVRRTWSHADLSPASLIAAPLLDTACALRHLQNGLRSILFRWTYDVNLGRAFAASRLATPDPEQQQHRQRRPTTLTHHHSSHACYHATTARHLLACRVQ